MNRTLQLCNALVVRFGDISKHLAEIQTSYGRVVYDSRRFCRQLVARKLNKLRLKSVSRKESECYG